MTTVKRKTVQPEAETSLDAEFREHLQLKDIAKQATTKSERLKKKFKEMLETGAQYTNDKGSKFLDLKQTIVVAGKSYSGMELRRSQPEPLFDEDAAERILARKGILEKALSSYVDQEKVLVLVQQGDLTEKDFDKMMAPQEPRWAFWPVEGEA